MNSQWSDCGGYTLIELLLAMTVFTTVMLVSTIGFIGINRTYTRGMVRKQLSEAVQRTNSELTRALRNAPFGADLKTCPPNDTCSVAPVEDWWSINLGNSCFLWKKVPETTGLYQSPSACNAVDLSKLTNIMDTRYKVQDLQVVPISTTQSLYKITGTFTTADEAALDLKSNPIRCLGSAQNVAVATCAVEDFNFIVNARGENI